MGSHLATINFEPERTESEDTRANQFPHAASRFQTCLLRRIMTA